MEEPGRWRELRFQKKAEATLHKEEDVFRTPRRGKDRDGKVTVCRAGRWQEGSTLGMYWKREGLI